jgi:hypothetical protein
MAASQGRNPYQWILLSFSFLIASFLHLLLFATAPNGHRDHRGNGIILC